MVNRIYLVGFMGAGKTTVGRLVAELMNWSFLDLDDEIERCEGRSITDIFSQSGEVHFRELEQRCLRSISGPRELVVALGGGTYEDASNREFIEARGLSVYLEASLEDVYQRIEGDGSRPLFSSRQRVSELYNQRLTSYNMARVRIETSHVDPAIIAQNIVRLRLEL